MNLGKLKCMLFGHGEWELEKYWFSFHSGLFVYKERCRRCGKLERNHRGERRGEYK